MKTLDGIMSYYGSDKASWHHNYTKYYEQVFESIRERKLTLLELGIGGEDTEPGGASLLAWEDYFPNADIVGIDIYDKDLPHKGRIRTYKGSQADENFLRSLIQDIGLPDIIIDDASHFNELTIKSFKILFPLLAPGGIYVIEDLVCSYRWDFGGSIDRNSNTIMNYLYSMLQDLNPIQEVAIPDYKMNEDFKDVESVWFSKELAIIRKKLC